jgi:putative hemolysin
MLKNSSKGEHPLSSLVFEILVIFFLLLANGMFAMSEIAVVSARKARLQQLAEEGNRGARAALMLTSDPNQFLATIQVGITLIGILAGAFGGATIAEGLGKRLSTVPAVAPYSHAVAVGIVVLGITYFSLIIGELVPKRLALGNAERIAAKVAVPMRLLSRICAPVVHLLSFSTNVAIRLLGVRHVPSPPVTPEELKVLIEQGTETGVFEEAEQEMIEGVLRLDERQVGAFMTPRTQIVWLDLGDSADDIHRQINESQYSRFPVSKGSLDNVLGILRTKDLLAQSLACKPLDLRPLLRPALFIPETVSALKALELLRARRVHLAMVTDEYGGIQGVVTHHDILEAIVGFIPSAGASTEPGAVRRDDGSWLIDGLMDVDELKQIFGLKKLPGEEQGSYHTVGGFIMSQTSNIPSAGQHFEWGNLRFEVVDMDGRRVDKVLVTPIQRESLGVTEG